MVEMEVARLSRLMPLEEVAKALGVSVYSVRRLVSRGALKSVRIGVRVMVSTDEVVRVQKEGVAPDRNVSA
jgi:excisionase family DNA binding protein